MADSASSTPRTAPPRATGGASHAREGDGVPTPPPAAPASSAPPAVPPSRPSVHAAPDASVPPRQTPRPMPLPPPLPPPVRVAPKGKVARVADQTKGAIEDAKEWVELRIALAKQEVRDEIARRRKEVEDKVAGIIRSRVVPAGIVGLLALCTLLMLLFTVAFGIAALLTIWVGSLALALMLGFLANTVLLGLAAFLFYRFRLVQKVTTEAAHETLKVAQEAEKLAENRADEPGESYADSAPPSAPVTPAEADASPKITTPRSPDAAAEPKAPAS